MASGIALPLANVLIGLSGIGTSIGFTVHEKNLLDELKKKAEKLHKDVTAAADLYDHVYYVIAVNLDRLRKAVDSLPSKFIETVQEDVDPELHRKNSIVVLGAVLGLGGKAFGAFAGANRFMGGLLGLVQYWRSKPSNAPTREGEPPLQEPTTVFRTPNFEKLVKGLNVARLVFGLAGLSAIIGIGVWTVDKLERAIADVDAKQKQVSAFQKFMEEALDGIVKNAELSAKSGYEELKTAAEMWKGFSQQLESYASRLCYAIQGYVMQKSQDDVKEIVEKHADASDKPFPDNCYDLAQAMADDIRVQFDKGKTDEEIVGFFTTDNPNKDLRCVLSGFFIGSLRDRYQPKL